MQDAFERASHAEALRQSEKLKSALLDAVTHDIRTPLTSIKASVSTLLNETPAKPLVKGAEVHLTPKEYDLLVHFVQNAGKVLTHQTLLAAVWGGNYIEQGEYLRVFVGQLRKKIEPTPSAPRYILTEP